MNKTNKKDYLRLKNTNGPLYPNAADHNYFAEKALNILTAIVSGMGFASAMLFLVTLS